MPTQCGGITSHISSSTRPQLPHRRPDSGRQLRRWLRRCRGSDGLAWLGNRVTGCSVAGSVRCRVCCQLCRQASPGSAALLVCGCWRGAQHRQSRVSYQRSQLGTEQSGSHFDSATSQCTRPGPVQRGIQPGHATQRIAAWSAATGLSGGRRTPAKRIAKTGPGLPADAGCLAGVNRTRVCVSCPHLQRHCFDSLRPTVGRSRLGYWHSVFGVACVCHLGNINAGVVECRTQAL